MSVFQLLIFGVGVGVPASKKTTGKGMADFNDLTLTAGQIAALLTLSIERVRQLVNAGYIPRIGKAKYPVVGAVQGYIRFLKDEEKRTSKSAADDNLKAARQREVELRIAKEEGRLVEMDDVEAVSSSILATLRAELAGLPASVTRDVKLREEIEKGLNGAFARSQNKFREASEALRSGRDPLGADREDDG
ncbi:hypothetical protein [Brucella intermedia]|uniref:hypothetical protein n=1 Tax=Brucella intermedia TaxID=94625 RepID=UPI0012DA6C14|nr:hypothetical protein [Brucella intermedia]